MAGTLRRRRKIVASIVAVAVAAVVAWAWKPWHTAKVTLPQSACWGTLTGQDLLPLVGNDGTATAQDPGDLVPPTLKSPSAEDLQPDICYIKWQGETIAHADISTAEDSSLAMAKTNQGALQPIELASGIWLVPGGEDVSIYFLCTGIQGGGTYGDAYAGSDSGGVNHEQVNYNTESERNAYANIALKLAKAATAQIPCTNHLAFPASVPALKVYKPF